MKRLITVLFAALLALPAFADVKITDGADDAEVNTFGSILVNEGRSTRPTYVASSSALVTTALYSLAIESGASQGFRLSKICVGIPNATAAAGVTISVVRTTAASTGGTALTAEGTGADSISKMDPGDGNWPGIARRTGTITVGAVLDQFGVQVGELGAGTADAPGLGIFCKDYGINGEKLPTVASGVTNGLAIRVSAPGAGGLAFGSIAATLIAD